MKENSIIKRERNVIISFKVQIAQIQLPPGVREKLQQQLAKLPQEQQELFKKHQPQVLLRLQQQLMKQQQGGTPSTGITKIPITVNVCTRVLDCCFSDSLPCSVYSYFVELKKTKYENVCTIYFVCLHTAIFAGRNSCYCISYTVLVRIIGSTSGCHEWCNSTIHY